MPYEVVIVETRGHVGLVTLDRPKALNALSGQLNRELARALARLEADSDVDAIVLTGSEKAFAAGADVSEMADKSTAEALREDFVSPWDSVARCRKPVIAAVAGYALGGGCELAMMCDIVLAADTARFGHPEITLGTIPGSGGSQRLARAVGKAKAMEMLLAARIIDAAAAERAGLVSRVVPAAEVVEEAVKVAARIGEMSRPVAIMATEAVDAAHETSLRQGVRFERRLAHATFATDDRREGMAAFVETRQPVFRDR